MGQNDLERVKADLEVMKNAAGIVQKYSWSEVFLNVIMGIIGLFLAALDLFVLKMRNPNTSIYLLCLLLLPMMVVIGIFNKKKDIKPKWPIWRFYWGRTIIGILFLWGLIAWCAKFNFPENNIMFVVIGGGYIIGGIETGIESFCYQNSYGLTMAIPMMILGFLIPIFPSYYITLFGLMMAVSSFPYAGIIAYVICRQKVSNGTD
jgi:uncharacterized membrane protein YeaQ/YmgE (transglycosylase-associated protein family)